MIRLFEVLEAADLEIVGRENVRCHWFVIQRKRPLFGPNGSLQPDYRGVISAGGHADVAEEFFTFDEATTFAEIARTRLDFHVTIEPVKLPIANSRKSFGALLEARADRLTKRAAQLGVEFNGAIDMLLLDDGAGNELDFVVCCYDEDEADEEAVEPVRN